MEIRAATTEDVEALLAFWRVATMGPSTTDDAASVAALVAHDAGALIVAVAEPADGCGGRAAIVGTVIAGWDGWRGTMYRLAVAPERRRCGIATALVQEAERRLCALGATRMHLIVDDGQPTGAAFWTAAGYTPTGQTRFVKTIGVDPDPSRYS